MTGVPLSVALAELAAHNTETGHTVTMRTLIGPASGHEAAWRRKYGKRTANG